MGGKDTEISKADERDIPSLYKLAEAMADVKEPGFFERCLAEQGASKRDVLIARHNDVPAGFAMLYWKPSYALYKRLGIPEIQDLNVAPEMRRQGVGAALIGYCESLARTKGCEQIGIAVGLDSSYGAAQRLYVRLGYVPDGYGITYDRQPVSHGEIRPVDGDLCLMMIKDLAE